MREREREREEREERERESDRCAIERKIGLQKMETYRQRQRQK